jgi:hypothetical protein
MIENGNAKNTVSRFKQVNGISGLNKIHYKDYYD